MLHTNQIVAKVVLSGKTFAIDLPAIDYGKTKPINKMDN